MKLLKTILVLFLLPAFTIAQPPVVKKERARHVLRKTAVIILVAHKKVKEGKVYTGNLARAIAHQKYAIKLYRMGEFYRAIHQSRRARHFAILAIKANKGAEMKEWEYSKEEQGALKEGPKDEELDKEMQKEMAAEPVKDEEVIKAEPAVDLSKDE